MLPSKTTVQTNIESNILKIKRLFGMGRPGLRWAGNNGCDRNVEEIISALNCNAGDAIIIEGCLNPQGKLPGGNVGVSLEQSFKVSVCLGIRQPLENTNRITKGLY
jgi:hypothetical protein